MLYLLVLGSIIASMVLSALKLGTAIMVLSLKDILEGRKRKVYLSFCSHR